MHLTPDSEDAVSFLVALANTAPGASRSGADELSTPAELTALLDAHGYTGRFDRDDAELADVLRARDELRAMWSLRRDELVGEINRWLRDVRALPFLVRHDDFDWHLHATEPDAPLADRIRAEGALALAEVVRADATARMRVCAADDCGGLLLDLSRNGSRRFCSVRCGNRVNQQGFRERMGAA
ncbi:CGNR zinc finger domain-containing protein [Naasia sp. SYSU D00057]|uniref:CGNR zinc finger domain-containing protein n=1 Tax=Naasia sp. SYSU D00057 TaxID=2817380 RepID=UPI001B306311|nr:CGNR zinc finger domain-containing protein [Naasia sp. SYSU D00057]